MDGFAHLDAHLTPAFRKENLTKVTGTSDPFSAETLPPGTTLGRYEIRRLIGRGGMGCVYEAVHRNGRHAAIKILRPELAILPQIRGRFLREGDLANRVGHPGAVAVLDDDVTPGGVVFLVMELLDGETLEARRKRTVTLQPLETLTRINDVLDVLACAHEKGIAQRTRWAHARCSTATSNRTTYFACARAA